jgi:[SSU ribosomal protein S18P]-alanine acetyltransferase (EC 2.3.1.128)
MSARPGFAPDCRIRPIRRGDLPAVLDIERRAYEFPWSEGVFRDCLRSAYGAWLAVGEDDGAARGYAVMSMAVGEAHVLNLCVDPGLQRLGIGRQILRHLMQVARAAGNTRMLLEVRRSNVAAQRLYQSAGFVRIGLRRGYYPAREGREDAWVLAFEIV